MREDFIKLSKELKEKIIMIETESYIALCNKGAELTGRDAANELMEKLDGIAQTRISDVVEGYNTDLIKSAENKIAFACLIKRTGGDWDKVFNDKCILNDIYGVIMQGTFDRNFINIQVKYPNQDIVFPEDMETIMNQVMYKDQLLRLARVTLQGFDNVIKGAEKYFVIEYSLELAAEYLNNIGINVDTLNKATKLERVVEIYDEAQEEPVAVICKLKKEQHTYEFALDSIKGV